MLTTSQWNTCLMIARGDLKEKDLKRPLSKEEKEIIKWHKKVFKERIKLGLKDFVDALCVDE